MICKWIVEPGGLRCETCGFKFVTDKAPEKVLRKCPGTMIHKVVNFGAAVVKHVARGSPKCTQEQIDERLRVCRTSAPDGSGGFCEYFTGHSCLACGCACNSDQSIMNKLALKDQACPVGKWPRLDGV